MITDFRDDSRLYEREREAEARAEARDWTPDHLTAAVELAVRFMEQNPELNSTVALALAEAALAEQAQEAEAEA
jgi:hypothetical protein